MFQSQFFYHPTTFKDKRIPTPRCNERKIIIPPPYEAERNIFFHVPHPRHLETSRYSFLEFVSFFNFLKCLLERNLVLMKYSYLDLRLQLKLQRTKQRETHHKRLSNDRENHFGFFHLTMEKSTSLTTLLHFILDKMSWRFSVYRI